MYDKIDESGWEIVQSPLKSIYAGSWEQREAVHQAVCGGGGDAKKYTLMFQPPAWDQTDAGTYTLNSVRSANEDSDILLVLKSIYSIIFNV